MNQNSPQKPFPPPVETTNQTSTSEPKPSKESKSTIIQTTASPENENLQNSENGKNSNLIKPFRLRNMINVVNSSKLSRKLILSSKDGLLTSQVESQSLKNPDDSPLQNRYSDDLISKMTTDPKSLNAQSEQFSKNNFQTANLLKSVQVRPKKSNYYVQQNESVNRQFRYNTFDKNNSVFARTMEGGISGPSRFISNSVSSSKVGLNNERDINNWNEMYEMSIDESYSIINLNEVSSQDIQYNLKKEFNSVAKQFGFHMIDFKVNFLYFVFVKNFNACFYQSSNIKNFCKFNFLFNFLIS
jgi:hypothetical protein